MARQVHERVPQEPSELCLGHLAGGHRELAMLDRARATDMAPNRYVVGRISEHHLRPLSTHEDGNGFGVESASADQPVGTEGPNIAGAA